VHFSVSEDWLIPAERVPSPNCDQRPVASSLDLIVIHNISLPPKQYGTRKVLEFFCNQLDCNSHPYFAQLKDVRVSSHLFIRRNGDVVQFVPFNLRAWHAGQSNFQGRNACNDFSIGIELEGSDDDPFEAAQYDNLIAVVQCLLRHYPSLSAKAIVGHSDIAPGRKTDPGPLFDWLRLRSAIST